MRGQSRRRCRPRRLRDRLAGASDGGRREDAIPPGPLGFIADAVRRNGMKPQRRSYIDRVAALIQHRSFGQVVVRDGRRPSWRPADMAQVKRSNSCLDGLPGGGFFTHLVLLARLSAFHWCHFAATQGSVTRGGCFAASRQRREGLEAELSAASSGMTSSN